MRKIVFTAITSLDGYIEDPNGDFGRLEPAEDLHQFANDKAAESSAFLLGRGLYETMVPFWPDAAKNPTGSEVMDEFARIYAERPRYVFSRTLESVDEGSTLVKGDITEFVEKLKQEPGDPMDLGGPGIGETFAGLGLVDQVCLMLMPVVFGGGKPALGPSFVDMEFELVDSIQFGSGAVAMTYERT